MKAEQDLCLPFIFIFVGKVVLSPGYQDIDFFLLLCICYVLHSFCSTCTNILLNFFSFFLPSTFQVSQMLKNLKAFENDSAVRLVILKVERGPRGGHCFSMWLHEK